MLLRKRSTKQYFDEIILGEPIILLGYYDVIRDYIDDNLIPNQAMEFKNELERKYS